MGMEIADTLATVLEPHGVAVHLSANHLGEHLERRSTLLGNFAMRDEFLRTLRGR